MKLEKLTIEIYKNEKIGTANNFGITASKPGKFEFYYNPTTMKYSKDIEYTTTCGEYSGSIDKKMEMEILYDTTLECQDSFENIFNILDAYTSPIVKGNDKSGECAHGNNDCRPPKLKLTWGKADVSLHYACCTISSIEWTYELFARNGKVIRAKAAIAFKAASEDDIEKVNIKTTNANTRAVKAVKMAAILAVTAVVTLTSAGDATISAID